uniref:JmjC domain-containing protein n=1 Tax=Cannabis sativa TaxID=3483 RepID=A0A803Q071_CANSA
MLKRHRCLVMLCDISSHAPSDRSGFPETVNSTKKGSNSCSISRVAQQGSKGKSLNMRLPYGFVVVHEKITFSNAQILEDKNVVAFTVLARHQTCPCSCFSSAMVLHFSNWSKTQRELSHGPLKFEQHLGQAVFVPAGCPFQVRNLQSNVQLGLDFLSPESLGKAVKLAEEIRCLPNEHEAKLQVLEVGKILLYAASAAIKEVQKLVLDPKLGLFLIT